jgi:phage-related protein
MPDEVQDAVGYALDLAQRGRRAAYAKPMKGRLRDVIEIRADDETGERTFRATYSVAFGDFVYVLDVFQKKAKRGIETARGDIERIAGRLKQAKDHYEKQRPRTEGR